mmetsp:Transcript_12020/g.38282  ORF Transcript_12020/g.38282 Transcript_12020/m.38282 type:complete len:404 (+) Transcript_12020:98-1309(+)
MSRPRSGSDEVERRAAEAVPESFGGHGFSIGGLDGDEVEGGAVGAAQAEGVADEGDDRVERSVGRRVDGGRLQDLEARGLVVAVELDLEPGPRPGRKGADLVGGSRRERAGVVVVGREHVELGLGGLELRRVRGEGLVLGRVLHSAGPEIGQVLDEKVDARGEELVEEGGRGVVRADDSLDLSDDRAGVHSQHRLEDGHPDDCVAALEGSLERRGAAIQWQERGMDVPRSVFRDFQESPGKELAVRRRHAQIRLEPRQRRQELWILRLGRRQARHAQRLGRRLRLAGLHDFFPAFRRRRLRDAGDHLELAPRRRRHQALQRPRRHPGRPEKHHALLRGRFAARACLGALAVASGRRDPSSRLDAPTLARPWPPRHGRHHHKGARRHGQHHARREPVRGRPHTK